MNREELARIMFETDPNRLDCDWHTYKENCISPTNTHYHKMAEAVLNSLSTPLDEWKLSLIQQYVDSEKIIPLKIIIEEIKNILGGGCDEYFQAGDTPDEVWQSEYQALCDESR